MAVRKKRKREGGRRKTDRCQGNEGNLHFVKLSLGSSRAHLEDARRVKGEGGKGEADKGGQQRGGGERLSSGGEWKKEERRAAGRFAGGSRAKFRVTLRRAVI